MLVMLVLVPMLLLILSPLQTNAAQVQPCEGLGGGHAGQVEQEGEEDGDASNAGACKNLVGLDNNMLVFRCQLCVHRGHRGQGPPPHDL